MRTNWKEQSYNWVYFSLAFYFIDLNLSLFPFHLLLTPLPPRAHRSETRRCPSGGTLCGCLFMWKMETATHPASPSSTMRQVFLTPQPQAQSCSKSEPWMVTGEPTLRSTTPFWKVRGLAISPEGGRGFGNKEKHYRHEFGIYSRAKLSKFWQAITLEQGWGTLGPQAI